MITLFKKNMNMMVIGVVLLSIITIPLLVEASTAEVDKIDEAVTIQPLPDKQPTKVTHADPFTLAIIGLSLGCMMVASSIHWNNHSRNEIEEQISTLTFLLENTSAIDCRINGSPDDDPMMKAVEDIKKKRNENIKNYETCKNDALQSISEIENEIIRIWG